MNSNTRKWIFSVFFSLVFRSLWLYSVYLLFLRGSHQKHVAAVIVNRDRRRVVCNHFWKYYPFYNEFYRRKYWPLFSQCVGQFCRNERNTNTTLRLIAVSIFRNVWHNFIIRHKIPCINDEAFLLCLLRNKTICSALFQNTPKYVNRLLEFERIL